MLAPHDTIRRFYDQSLTYDSFVALGQPNGQDAAWHQRYEQTALTDEQTQLIQGFTRKMHVLCLTGTWCGDCALQGAAMQRVAEANPNCIDLRFVLKSEENAEIVVKSAINQGFRVPVTFFLSEDMQLVDSFGDRTLSRYRSMARKDARTQHLVQAPAPENPVTTVRDEVVALFERTHLLLRLSGRLRQKHND